MSEDHTSVPGSREGRSVGLALVAIGVVVLLAAPLSTLVGGDAYFLFGRGLLAVTWYPAQLMLGALPAVATAIVLILAVRRPTAVWPLVLLVLGGVATVAAAVVASRWVGA